MPPDRFLARLCALVPPLHVHTTRYCLPSFQACQADEGCTAIRMCEKMMPDKGRVAVSPSGKLYFMPADYFAPGDILAWDLPPSL